MNVEEIRRITEDARKKENTTLDKEYIEEHILSAAKMARETVNINIENGNFFSTCVESFFAACSEYLESIGFYDHQYRYVDVSSVSGKVTGELIVFW